VNNSDCAKKVLDWAIREAMTASVEHNKSICAVHGNQEAIKTWKKLNPNDGVGGFSTNPYERDSEYLMREQDRNAKTNTEKQAILEFVKTKICNLIP